MAAAAGNVARLEKKGGGGERRKREGSNPPPPVRNAFNFNNANIGERDVTKEKEKEFL